MKLQKILITLILFSYMPCFAGTSNKKGLEWATKVYNRPDGDSQISTMEMILENKSKKRRSRKLYAYALDTGKKKYMLMRFLKPADVKNLGLLTIDEDGKDNDQWLYLPALGKTKKISSSGKGGRFAGSDIFFEDLSDRPVSKDHHKFTGHKNYKGTKLVVIESVPKKKSSSVYKKRVVWIHPKTLLPVKVELYKKNLKKPDKISETVNIKNIDGFWTVTESVITDLRKKHKTYLKISKIKYNVDIKKDLFSNKTLLDSTRENKYRKL